ncbi:NAD(P)H-dependent oxidoreductase [Alteromonas gilva]|uniref:NAD(P)H-dependent oxidoreductase n=1 Tax=Alteromonas gilva TaxID=2987522 RepID=A0ABT5L2M5_9ALTE|nr:NAD(P)H-dependent oxidoreductase [Alteromonas gilva]MDC8830679.1 NAD(P)H-dependent oxidoreductase [Alteromonas gilva]
MPAEQQKNSQHKILVLFAHPSQAQSEVNVAMFAAAQQHDAVTAIDLYAEYPDFNINIGKEQERLLAHDIIVFQFPMYWYSTPSILKEWQDLVLEYGFAYGTDGTALAGKRFLCALSAGGREEAFQSDGFNHFTLRELLQPLEQMADITRMVYLAPFALFGSRTAKEEHRVTRHTALWSQLLDSLADGEIDIQRAAELENLTSYFSTADDTP